MKKLSTLILVCLMGFIFLFTGCGTVDPIVNNDDELIYNGNSVVNIDGYLYYANSFKSYKELTSDDDYNSSVANSYLARLNTNVNLEAKDKDHSPKTVENVSPEIAGQENGFMFTLGDHIYYTTPNRKEGRDENGTVTHFYNYIAFYRSNLNGDGKNLFYTADAEVSEIEVLKSNGQYYIVMLVGSRLVKIQIGKDIGNVVTLAENVTSVAMPETYEKNNTATSIDWNGYIYYTTDAGAYRVNLVDGSSRKMVNSNITFIDRHKDVLFFTESGNTTSVCYANVTDGNSSFAITNNKQYLSGLSSISDINMISVKKNTQGGVEVSDLGFTFVYSGSLYACKFGQNPVKLTLNDSEGNTLSNFKIVEVFDGAVYLSTETGLYKIDLNGIYSETNKSKTLTVTTLAKMTKVYVETNLTSFDGKYLYYFATLEGLEENGEVQTVEDQTFYLYRVNISGTEGYQLLSLTSSDDRHS
ncbi:MAG: hypothetical protein K2K31_00895 [Clostridia bacterium]|nr:hypothetical protein [Clostridia bacterium]